MRVYPKGFDVRLRVPARFIRPDGRPDFPAITRLFKQKVALGAAAQIPLWIYMDSVYGKQIFDYLFRYCVKYEWKLDLVKKDKRIDPRLQRKNQKALLKELSGTGNWDALMRRYKLRAGLRTHYGQRVLDAFKANYAWAFDPELESHLHDNDFAYRHMYNEVEVGGVIWNLVDHLIRIDLGVVLYDPVTGKVDRRLLPENRNELAQSRGYKNWVDFERRSGLYTLLTLSPVAKPVLAREEPGERARVRIVAKGNLGQVLKWRFPKAFAPTIKGHLHVTDFGVDPAAFNILDKREMLLHIAVERGIPTVEIPRWMTPRVLAAHGSGYLLKPGQTVLELFKECFAEEIRRGDFGEGLFFAQIEGGKFKLDGRDYVFEGLSHRCILARRETDEHIVIYERSRRIIVGKSRALLPRWVVSVNDPTKLQPVVG